MKKLSVLVFVAVAASGCGIKRVPLKVLDQLPYEAKIELLESENDLALAVDQLDEARANVARTRDQIRRAKDRYDAARSEVNQAPDSTSKEVAELAVAEATARVDWLRALQKVNGREEELAEQNETCGYARYEVARLAAARKAKLEGSEKLDPAEFEAQLKRCEEKYAGLKEQLKSQGDEASAVRAEWDKAKATLAKKTFDARASPYVELE
jgi:multidrug resistance efflux pump